MHTVPADRPERHAEAAAQPALEPSHVPLSRLVEAEAEIEASGATRPRSAAWCAA